MKEFTITAKNSCVLCNRLQNRLKLNAIKSSGISARFQNSSYLSFVDNRID